MTKKFKTVKASFVTALMLASLIIAVVPHTSAGIIFDLQSVLNVTWGNETQEPIVPRGELRSLTLVITHTIARGTLGEGILVSLTGALIKIDVSVIEKSSWCTAVISQGTLSVTVQPNAVSTVETTVTIQVANEAPAYGLGYVKIKAAAEQTGIIAGYANEFTLNFIPAYNALISVSLPEANSKEIGPMDTVVFPVEITNLGNARTIVLLNVDSIPEGWNAIITSQLVLEEAAGSQGTAFLIIQPPRSFGYHNDEKTIKISMQPVKADDPTKKGQITYETFLVQSRGFSLPGFEMVLFLCALSLTAFIIAYTRKRTQ
jgi:hypothetical protein